MRQRENVLTNPVNPIRFALEIIIWILNSKRAKLNILGWLFFFSYFLFLCYITAMETPEKLFFGPTTAAAADCVLLLLWRLPLHCVLCNPLFIAWRSSRESYSDHFLSSLEDTFYELRTIFMSPKNIVTVAQPCWLIITWYSFDRERTSHWVFFTPVRIYTYAL